MIGFKIFVDRVEKEHVWGKSIIYTTKPEEAFTQEELKFVIDLLDKLSAELGTSQKDFLKKIKLKVAAEILV